MQRPPPALLLALAGVLAFPVRGTAQGGNASIPAEAVVVTSGMTIATLRDLTFGTVTAGVGTTVQPVDAASGAWQVTGGPNAFAAISFTLPSVLTNIQALPGSVMPIAFSSTSARWRRANSDPAGGNAFNPATGATGRFGPPPNPTLYIWIGGTVTPAPTAKPGIYQGTIVVSLVYP